MEGVGLNREPRYEVADGLFIRVLARPFGMKYYNFELVAVDVSRSGVHIYSPGKAFVPFRKGGRVVCTFDIHASVFERPIHMVLDIVRHWDQDQHQHFAAKIVSVETYQKSIFERDIKKLKIIDQVVKEKGKIFQDVS